MTGLEVKGNQFYIDGEAVQLISGGMHYFRVVPAYWEDRLLKLKACGFNAVETYVPWNLHEPHEGEFHFSGLCDLEAFIRTAERIGLYVIVRPSPYICAEWEFGGLPAWLLADSNLRIRSHDTAFLEKVDAYYDVLMPKLRPLLHTNGGPIIAMQIENEYGSYGNDKAYLTHLKEAMVTRGIDVLLFTSDGPSETHLQGGTLDGVLPTVNFGSRPGTHFPVLQQYAPGIPNMVMEYWIGWFDHWGEEHHTRGGQDAADTFREMLAGGASVNFFMFHGGTNFAFWNGANHGETYEPTVTSYDYDSLLTESGDVTEKFHQVRAVINDYWPLGELTLPEPIPKKAYGQVELTEKVNLFDALDVISTPVLKTHPVTMEKLGQNYGFTLYRTFLQGPHGSSADVRADREVNVGEALDAGRERSDDAGEFLNAGEGLDVEHGDSAGSGAEEDVNIGEASGDGNGYSTVSREDQDVHVSEGLTGRHGDSVNACEPLEAPLTIQEVRDRALVFVDGIYKGVVDRWRNNTIDIAVPAGGARLDILVENLGRVNYGPYMYDPKGITEGVRFGQQFLFDWTIFPLPMDRLEKLPFAEEALGTDEFIRKGDISQPAFHRGVFHVEEVADTFVELPDWVKGFVVVNGFNIGRYWEIGPQQTLYVPGPLLCEGENELVIFELHETENETVSLIDHPILG